MSTEQISIKNISNQYLYTLLFLHYPNRMCCQNAAIKIEKFLCIFAKKINI